MRLKNINQTAYLAILIAVSTLPMIAKADVPFRGFTDFGYITDRNTESNSFQIHDLDLFVSGPVDKHVSYTAEINFQPGFDGVVVDLERTFVQYTVNPWFKVAAGRFHTALGYWNDTYHHGSYLATAASRPLMERFEDSGGILPVHNTGIEVRGNGPAGHGNLGYIFNVGNGRGPVKDPPSFFNSYSKTKSISGVGYYEFDNGLRVGANFWRSTLPGGYGLAADSTQNLNALGPNGTEYIMGAHLIYNTANIEWLTEYQHMLHHYINGSQNADGSTETKINLLYSQLGYHLGLYTPYVRYEIDATSTADAYLNASPGYTAQGLLATTRNYVLGARYELSSNSALKFEYTYISSGAPVFQANLPNPTPLVKTTDWLTQLNWSLAF